MLIKNLRILACLPKEAMMKKKSGLSTKLVIIVSKNVEVNGTTFFLDWNQLEYLNPPVMTVIIQRDKLVAINCWMQVF